MTSLLGKQRREVASEGSRRFEISVVIPTLGRSPHLRGLLERLQRQGTDFAFEVLVVANIPQQELRKLVNSMNSNPRVQFEYLETGRLGVNLARNKGLDRGRAEIVLFLDDDALLDDDQFVARHLIAHKTYSDAVAIGGPYRLTSASNQWDRAYHEIAHDWLRRHRRRGHRSTQLLGGNLSLKKSQLEKHQWKFDEAIAFGGAETGLCLRIANAKQPMYFLESLEIGHAPELTSFSFRRKAFLQGAGARWRSREIAKPEFQFVNELEFDPIEFDPITARGRRIYRQCFDFGWKSAPYNSKAQKTAPDFSILRFYIFLFTRNLKLSPLIRLHRRVYTAIRTAWINGEKSRRS